MSDSTGNSIASLIQDLQALQQSEIVLPGLNTTRYTVVNRMIIKRGVEAERDPILYDPAARETPFRPRSVTLGEFDSYHSDEFIQYDLDVMKV
ncbi:hypothetical protein Clacol_000196 [Clathrus columnatus]|uniref:Uncharacterized protein n=1 Tax=Clathrus columnatus TaxID=1419009 RepID=A0AAV5A028_9AGAM|nr:hypothetical protein Clacol_000196 [Clathrus columnatus]